MFENSKNGNKKQTNKNPKLVISVRRWYYQYPISLNIYTDKKILCIEKIYALYKIFLWSFWYIYIYIYIYLTFVEYGSPNWK